MSRWQFETDRRRQLRLIERILEINAGRHQVLDDWHSHQPANCSPVDDWRKRLIDITSLPGIGLNMSRRQFEADRRQQLRLIKCILEVNAGRRQVLDD